MTIYKKCISGSTIIWARVIADQTKYTYKILYKKSTDLDYYEFEQTTQALHNGIIYYANVQADTEYDIKYEIIDVSTKVVDETVQIVHTQPAGSMSYKIDETTNSPTSDIISTLNTNMSAMIQYMNAAGNFPSVRITCRYNPAVETASCGYNGIMQTSGGEYATIPTMIHELSHFWGIGGCDTWNNVPNDSYTDNTYFSILDGGTYGYVIGKKSDEIAQFFFGRDDAHTMGSLVHSSPFLQGYPENDEDAFSMIWAQFLYSLCQDGIVIPSKYAKIYSLGGTYLEYGNSYYYMRTTDGKYISYDSTKTNNTIVTSGNSCEWKINYDSGIYTIQHVGTEKYLGVNSTGKISLVDSSFPFIIKCNGYKDLNDNYYSTIYGPTTTSLFSDGDAYGIYYAETASCMALGGMAYESTVQYKKKFAIMIEHA